MLCQEFPSEGIYIKSVHAQNCGPIVDKNMEFSPFTLVYSRNEGGKTYLVEGIVCKLFGKVRGIVERENIGRIKLTLCVNGSEVAASDGGIDGGLLDFMVIRAGRGNIPISRIEEVVYGDALHKLEMYVSSKAGIKPRVLQTEISELKGLIERLEKIGRELFTLGTDARELYRCEKKLKKLNHELEEVKRKEGCVLYLMRKELANIKERILTFARISIKQVSMDIARYRKAIDERENIESSLKEVDKEIERLEIYDLWKASHRYVMYFSLSLVAGGLIFSAFYNGLLGSIISACGAMLVVFLSGRMKEYKKRVKDYEKHYNERFSTVGLADDRSLKRIKDEYLKRRREIEEEVSKLKMELQSKFSEAGIRRIEESDLEGYLQKLGEEEDRLKEDKLKLEMAISEMESRGIEPIYEGSAGYTIEELISTYSSLRSERDQLEAQIRNLKDRKDQVDKKILELKSELKGIMGKEILNMDMKSLRDCYYAFLEEKEKELRRKEAKLFVRENILKLVAVYKEKGVGEVKEALKEVLPVVSNLGGYESIDIYKQNGGSKNKTIVLKKNGEIYTLFELSTGLLEQLFVAIRLAILKKRAKGKMFVLFDDAFQYSDWKRREKLVDELKLFSGRGWQVIYFTMDKHIKKLFWDRGATIINLT